MQSFAVLISQFFAHNRTQSSVEIDKCKVDNSSTIRQIIIFKSFFFFFFCGKHGFRIVWTKKERDISTFYQYSIQETPSLITQKCINANWQLTHLEVQSPDSSQTENIWCIMKWKIQQRRPRTDDPVPVLQVCCHQI